MKVSVRESRRHVWRQGREKKGQSVPGYPADPYEQAVGGAESLHTDRLCEIRSDLPKIRPRRCKTVLLQVNTAAALRFDVDAVTVFTKADLTICSL
jgi:hypothetical protein